jgi:EF-P beta-lysylation protein EpmB
VPTDIGGGRKRRQKIVTTVTEQTRQQLPLDSWQRQMANAIRDPEELLELLELGAECLEPARRAAKLFPLLVPRGYVDLMQKGNPRDPLLLQVLPLGEEEIPASDFVLDAVGDQDARRAPGLLHKYDGRALLITTGSCAIHCRYCFRRYYPYADDPKRLADWHPALQVLRNDSTIHEVILSGGDPLMLTDHRLGELLQLVEAIPHLKRLRIHTRLPIVLPDRVTPRLLELLTENRMTPIIVVHANHPQELLGSSAAVLRAIVKSGCTVLNQAVLLRGINDNVDTLSTLCEKLVDLGVIPYYLHQLDRVAGTAHFEVPEVAGREMIANLRTRLPGYAVPEYVREIAGEKHKSPIMA